MPPRTLLTLVLLAIVAALAAFGLYPLALAGVVAWLALVFWATVRARGAHQNPADALRPESRIRLRPLRRMADELRQIVASGGSNETIQAVGKEALAESDRLLRQCAASLLARERLAKLAQGLAAPDSARGATTDQIAAIDDGLNEALSALEQMKTRLASCLDAGAEGADGDLRDSLMRVRAVTLSVDEAEEIVRG